MKENDEKCPWPVCAKNKEKNSHDKNDEAFSFYITKLNPLLQEKIKRKNKKIKEKMIKKKKAAYTVATTFFSFFFSFFFCFTQLLTGQNHFKKSKKQKQSFPLETHDAFGKNYQAN